MEITDRISIISENCTVSRISVDGQEYGWSLQDPLRATKIKKITGIPCGTFDVKLTFSNKYSPKYGGVNVPEIIVTGWGGLRFHAGNRVEDTEGCVMVGAGYRKSTISDNTIGEYYLLTTSELSKQLNLIIMAAINRGETVTYKKYISE